jgi:hypothetical protein
MEAALVVRRLHRHRIWSNAQLVAACRGLSRVQLDTPFAIGQGSVWASLVHLLAADALWLDAFTDRPDSPAPGADFQGLDDLAARWGHVNRRWQEVLAGLDDGQLERPVRRVDLAGKLYGFDGLDAHLQSARMRRTRPPRWSTCCGTWGSRRCPTACSWR